MHSVLCHIITSKDKLHTKTRIYIAMIISVHLRQIRQEMAFFDFWLLKQVLT